MLTFVPAAPYPRSCHAVVLFLFPKKKNSTHRSTAGTLSHPECARAETETNTHRSAPELPLASLQQTSLSLYPSQWCVCAMRRAQGSQLYLEEGREVGGVEGSDVTTGGKSSLGTAAGWLCRGVTAAPASQAAGGQAADGGTTTSRRRRRRVAMGMVSVC